MAITRINFQSIPVDDQDRAIAFYTENLGFSVHTDAPYSRRVALDIPGTAGGGNPSAIRRAVGHGGARQTRPVPRL